MRIEVTIRSMESDARLTEYIEQRLRRALARFQDRIRRVDVSLSDRNGPRGGIDKRIAVVVRLRHSGTVVVDTADANSCVAIADAVRRVRRSVFRAVDRRRTRRRRTPGITDARFTPVEPLLQRNF